MEVLLGQYRALLVLEGTEIAVKLIGQNNSHFIFDISFIIILYFLLFTDEIKI